jgi:hypothetical protein
MEKRVILCWGLLFVGVSFWAYFAQSWVSHLLCIATFLIIFLIERLHSTSCALAEDYFYDTEILTTLRWGKDYISNFHQILRLHEGFQAVKNKYSTRDADKFFSRFKNLVTSNANVKQLVSIKQEDLTVLRNSFAHCNCFSQNWQGMKNQAQYEQLRALFPTHNLLPADHLPKKQVYMWNIHEGKLKFLLEMEAADFRNMMDEFQEICKKAVKDKQHLIIPDVLEPKCYCLWGIFVTIFVSCLYLK